MAESVPSIKGVFLQAVVADAAALVGRNPAAQRASETRLTDADRKLLAGQVVAALWYPAGCWGRMIELLRDFEGGGEPRRYLNQRGVRAAARVIELGIFGRQLEAFQGERLARVGQIIATLSANIFNFGKWSFVDATGDVPPRIEIADGAGFPASAEPIFEGFIEALLREGLHLPVQVRSARPTLDLLQFRLVAAP